MPLSVKSLLIFAGALAISTPLHAQPTGVTVRVIAEDAKYVGDAVGGAHITLRDAETGAVLASGVTTGGTGDTGRIMEASGRSPLRATADAAAFVTAIDISRPTLVTLEASGPVALPQSAVHVTAQRWVMPGEAVDTGDGWTVELPGLAVSVTAPFVHTRLPEGGRTVAVNASVMLLCGCPITPGGKWDAKDYGVEVTAYQAGRRVAAGKLDFLAAPGRFGGSITLPKSGVYELVVYARNLRTGNAGLGRSTVIAQ